MCNIFKEPALLILKSLCNWTSISQKMQLRILSTGLLYGSLTSVHLLLPYIQEDNEVCLYNSSRIISLFEMFTVDSQTVGDF